MKPTIKGIFVKSHVNRVRSELGEDGVKKLKKLFGKNIEYKNSQDVPVSEEVRLIECALMVLNKGKVAPEKLAFEAGRLHFKNFSTTPLARIIFSLFRPDFKKLMLNADKIAGHVFRGTRFITSDPGKNKVTVTMENNDYPIDHFRGLFCEWMAYSGLKGTVSPREKDNNVFEYAMEWK